jgi:hypothetical protein
MKTSRRPSSATRPPMAANPAATSPRVSGTRPSEASRGLTPYPTPALENAIPELRRTGTHRRSQGRMTIVCARYRSWSRRRLR